MSRIRYLTSGESHGPVITVIIDGLPSGIPVEVAKIDEQLKLRQGGYGRGERMKIEKDEISVNSGVRFGKTLGSPICLEIRNKDWKNWDKVMSLNFSEGHDSNGWPGRPAICLRGSVVKNKFQVW